MTVIIPARNEQETIGEIVKLVKKHEKVKQVLVVDNNSVDDTAKVARECGAEAIFCEKQGKGYAMEAGLTQAKNDIIVFLDADIKGYQNNLIDLLTNDILNNEADFIKSTFKREGGRVTELVAKPLLKIAYPEMYRFSQPLSGMIAGKLEVFKRIIFEKDYGVDVGILLDVIALNARVKEVNIGELANNQHEWSFLNKMAEEVMMSIIRRRYK